MVRPAQFATFLCLAGAMVGCAQSPRSDAAPDPASKTEAPSATWTESYVAARAQAQADKKLILADFTGSDWCHYCVQLRREVLNKPDFKKWAASHFVLLEVDYPRMKRQADDVKAQNEHLKNQFNVDGYPTVVVMNSDGKEVGRIVGYDGAKEWSDELQKVVKRGE
jgi:protein disulfide-isomerase